MEKLKTVKDYVDKVAELRTRLTNLYGIRFGRGRLGKCVLAADSARITVLTFSGRARTTSETGKNFTLEEFEELLEKEFPEFDYTPIDLLNEFGALVWFRPERFLRVAYVQFYTDDPQPVYIWFDDGKKLIYTYSCIFDRCCHYTATQKTDIFDTAQGAKDSLKQRLREERETLERAVKEAQQRLQKCIARLEELEKE